MNKLDLSIKIFVLLAIVFALLGWSINGLTSLFVIIFTSLIFSIVAGAILESFTGDLLKNYGFVFEVRGIKIPISLFLIGVILLKIFLF